MTLTLGKPNDTYPTNQFDTEVTGDEIKKTICLMYLPPTDLIRLEYVRDIMKQLKPLMLLPGNMDAHNHNEKIYIETPKTN